MPQVFEKQEVTKRFTDCPAQENGRFAELPIEKAAKRQDPEIENSQRECHCRGKALYAAFDLTDFDLRDTL